MATVLTKNTFVRGRIGAGAWVQMSGRVSGMDPPEFAPASEARVVPSQSDFEQNMSSGVTRADLSLTVDLRDGMGDPGSTIPVLQNWTGKTIQWQIGWGALDTADYANLLPNMPMAQFNQVCNGVVPSADGPAWRLAITGPVAGEILYGLSRDSASGAGAPIANNLPAGFADAN